jgi:hypothetical protein
MPSYSSPRRRIARQSKFGAKMIVSGATTYYRTDPLTIQIGNAYGWTAAQIDAFFTAASAL